MHALHHEVWGESGADAGPVTTVVTYCRTGMQASHAYFVARYIGYADVRLYDGSFLEWAGLPAADNPVAR
jgi:thiosulfate/3-mercaptopyruvate sulfurtransferase